MSARDELATGTGTSADPGTVYLIHFDRPHHRAGHYLGYTANLEQRLADHRAGRGSRLLAHITAIGIAWSVVRTWSGGRTLERKLKNAKDAHGLCPVCKAARLRRKAEANRRWRARTKQAAAAVAGGVMEVSG